MPALPESIAEVQSRNKAVVAAGKTVREFHERVGYGHESGSKHWEELEKLSTRCDLVIADFLETMARLRPAALEGINSTHIPSSHEYEVWKDIAQALREPEKAAVSTVLLASSLLGHGGKSSQFFMDREDAFSHINAYTLSALEDLPFTEEAYHRASYHIIEKSKLAGYDFYPERLALALP